MRVAWNKNLLGWKKKKVKSFLVPCLECKKEVLRSPSTLKLRTFCSRNCHGLNDKKNPLHGSWNKGLKRTPEHIEKIRQIAKEAYASGKRIHHYLGKKRPDFTGVNNPKWIVDRSKIKVGDRSLHDSNYKQWHKAVKNRDGWKCKISNGDCSGRLEAHHILGWKSHPELRYQINNGITLCHFHHPRTRTKEMELSPYFQELVLKGN